MRPEANMLAQSWLFSHSNICFCVEHSSNYERCTCAKILFNSSSHLQSQPHSLGDSSLREDSLNLRDQLTGQPTALWTNEITLLLYTRHYCKVEGEVSGDDSTDSLLLQLLLALQVYIKVKEWRKAEKRDKEERKRG